MVVVTSHFDWMILLPRALTLINCCLLAFKALREWQSICFRFFKIVSARFQHLKVWLSFRFPLSTKHRKMHFTTATWLSPDLHNTLERSPRTQLDIFISNISRSSRRNIDTSGGWAGQSQGLGTALTRFYIARNRIRGRFSICTFLRRQGNYIWLNRFEPVQH